MKGNLTQDDGQRAVLIAFKFLHKLGLGSIGGQMSSLVSLAPPLQFRDHVVRQLTTLLKTDSEAIATSLGTNPTNDDFNKVTFDEWMSYAGVPTVGTLPAGE